MKDTNKLADLGTGFSICIYLFTSAIKIIFGTLGHSKALVTDGLNSISDVISTGILFVGLRLSRKPRDNDHTYGHEKYETLSTFVASLIMFLIGFQALLDAIKSLFIKRTDIPSSISIYAAIISIILILISAYVNAAIAKKTKMATSRAIVKNNISDAVTACGALIAILASQYNLPIIDTIASFIISLIIIYTAWSIFRESELHLTDGYNAKELTDYKLLIESVRGVEEVKDIRARTHGNYRIIDTEIAVDGDLKVKEAHYIADQIELLLKLKYGIQQTTVHVEPFSK